MPTRTPWIDAFATGDAALDERHREMLLLCEQMAGLCRPDAEAPFDAAFAQLKALVREHFATEADRLDGQGDEALEDHQLECEDFDHLVDEVATTEHFSRLEIQRFVAGWCLGHVRAAAA